jgi:ABC-2 type transport system permease protein
MSLRNVATIAAKDLRILLSKLGVRLAIVLFPLTLAIGLPMAIRYGGGDGGVPAPMLPQVLDALTFFFVIGTAILPTAIATYSLVGEKVERSLEPLLAAPVTDTEILLGKSIAAFLPPIAAIWAAATVFMALCDEFTRPRLGYLYFPNATAMVILGVVAPMAAILCVELSVLISARVSDVRAAQQLGTLIVLPFTALYVLTVIGVLALDGTTLGALVGVLAAIDVGLVFATRATFRREEILTRWT